MHIPENYLSPQTCAVMTAAVLPAWIVSVRKIRTEIPKEKLPMLGAAAAFSFLGMMFNVPLPGGTTGHAVGGTLIAMLFGPYAACISVSVALLLQALLFGDGGVLAFGANCFNMAFVLPFTGYAVYRLVTKFLSRKGESLRARLIGGAAGSYAGINAAALCAAIEFGIQPLLFRDASGNAMYCPYGLSVSIPAMMAGHLTVFGLAEVLFTVLVYAFVEKAAPEICVTRKLGEKMQGEKTGLPLKIFLAALILLTPLGLLAEGTAWGEWGTDEIASTGAGYIPPGMAGGWEWSSLLPDYSFTGMPAGIGYILSALIGTALLLIVFKLLSLGKKA